MKKFSLRRITKRYAAFTLVELLVVIGIIAILAGVTMQVGTLVLKEAKKAKAQNTATQIQTAALSYYTEYSVYPTVSGSTTSGDWMIGDSDTATGLSTSPGASPWGALIQCLSGNVSPTASTLYSPGFTNTRAIAFLTLKSSDVSTTAGHLDAPVNPLTSGNLYFNIAFDGDYDGIIGKGSTGTSTAWLPKFTTSFTGSATMTGSSTAGIAVWANCNTTTPQTSGWWVHTY